MKVVRSVYELDDNGVVHVLYMERRGKITVWRGTQASLTDCLMSTCLHPTSGLRTPRFITRLIIYLFFNSFLTPVVVYLFA